MKIERNPQFSYKNKQEENLKIRHMIVQAGYKVTLYPQGYKVTLYPGYMQISEISGFHRGYNNAQREIKFDFTINLKEEIKLKIENFISSMF